MTARADAAFISSRRVRLLAAAVVWMGYFAVVYLVGEWRCRPGDHSTSKVLGIDTTTAIIVIATVVAVVAIVAMTRRTLVATDAPTTQDSDDARLVAKLLAALFVLATVVVGIVPLAVGPC